jgi:hypothetical protein
VDVSTQTVSLAQSIEIVPATAPEDRCARIVAQLSVLPVQKGHPSE